MPFARTISYEEAYPTPLRSGLEGREQRSGRRDSLLLCTSPSEADESSSPRSRTSTGKTEARVDAKWHRHEQRSGTRDSNPRHPAWEAGTLPTELVPQSDAVRNVRRCACQSSTAGADERREKETARVHHPQMACPGPSRFRSCDRSCAAPRGPASWLPRRRPSFFRGRDALPRRRFDVRRGNDDRAL